MTETNELKFDPSRQIAIIWDIEDVQQIRPDLTDEQAMDVLLEVEDNHDAEWGVSWTTLEATAGILFPKGSNDDGDDDFYKDKIKDKSQPE